jgi:hypothetical protein
MWVRLWRELNLRTLVSRCERDFPLGILESRLSIVQTHRARGYTSEAVFEIEN